MHVAQLIETLGFGGAERLAVDIAGACRRRGHASTLITLSEPGPLLAEIDPGVTVHSLAMDPGDAFSQGKALIRLVRLCRRLRPDALQTHLPRANFFGLGLALATGIPVFPTVHNNREFDYGEGPGRLRRRLRRAAYRSMLDRCRTMIAVSEAVRQALGRELDLADGTAGRIAVVTNGVRIPAEADPAVRERWRGDFNVPADGVLIAAVGRLSPQKNFQDLIRALGRLDNDLPPWRCVIAGEGPQREELADLIEAEGLQGRILLAGALNDVQPLLGAADVFCMPSLWEGLPLALLEAMAAGLPVAAYAIDGVREVVQDGRTGRLASPGAADELAGALTGLLGSPRDRAALGAAGRTLVEQRFGLEAMIDELVRIYAGRV